MICPVLSQRTKATCSCRQLGPGEHPLRMITADPFRSPRTRLHREKVRRNYTPGYFRPWPVSLGLLVKTVLPWASQALTALLFPATTQDSFVPAAAPKSF